MNDPRPAGENRPGERRLTEREKVVRAFLRDDRLVSIPAKIEDVASG